MRRQHFGLMKRQAMDSRHQPLMRETQSVGRFYQPLNVIQARSLLAQRNASKKVTSPLAVKFGEGLSLRPRRSCAASFRKAAQQSKTSSFYKHVGGIWRNDILGGITFVLMVHMLRVEPVRIQQFPLDLHPGPCHYLMTTLRNLRRLPDRHDLLLLIPLWLNITIVCNQ